MPLCQRASGVNRLPRPGATLGVQGEYAPSSARRGTGWQRGSAHPLVSIRFILVRREHGETFLLLGRADWTTVSRHVCVVSDDGAKREEHISRRSGKAPAGMAEWIASECRGDATKTPPPSGSHADLWSQAPSRAGALRPRADGHALRGAVPGALATLRLRREARDRAVAACLALCRQTGSLGTPHGVGSGRSHRARSTDPSPRESAACTPR